MNTDKGISEMESLTSVPMIYDAFSASLAEFKMNHMIDRMSLRTVREMKISGEKDVLLINLGPWQFVLVRRDDKEIVVPLPDPGAYSIDVGEIIDRAAAKFPIRLRQVEILLDGSVEKWETFVEAPMN